MIWFDVYGYEGIYMISNTGIVKSLSRKIGLRTLKEKTLKPVVNTKGYLQCCLSKSGCVETFEIHRLLMISAYGINENLVVDHIDGNRLNNNLENLQFITNRHNTSKSMKNKTSKYTGVSKSGNRWRSRIMINSNVIELGVFDEEYDAYLAYQKELKKL